MECGEPNEKGMHMIRSTHRRWRAAALLCAAVLMGTTACASSTGGSGTGSTSGGGLTDVPLALTGLNALHLWMIVARDEKLMEPQGIKMDLVIFSGQAQVVPSLLSGASRFASSTPEQAMAAHLQEKDLKLVVGTETGSPYSLIANPDITSIKDLRGKKIGVNAVASSADYFAGKLLLADKGLQEGADYTFINVGVTAQRVAALQANQVSAVLLFPPDTAKALDGGAKQLALATDSPALKSAMTGGLISLSSWYDANKDVATRFVKGYQNTMQWLYNPANRAQAVKDFAAQFKISAAAAGDVYDYFITNVHKDEDLTGMVHQDSLAQTLKNAESAGLKSLSSVKSTDLSSFYDNALVDAAKSGS